MKAVCFCSLLMFLACNTSYAAVENLQYDANGNFISGKGKYYEYNEANKLIRVREGSIEGPVIGEYTYDYQGQRVKKVENGITTYYIGKQYEERRGTSTNEKTNFYFAGGQRVARKTKQDNKTAETFWYLNNHLGSAEVITNVSGSVVDQMQYYPYGSIRNSGKERYSYTGKEKDSGTGEYYYEARYYDGLTHHFDQADTVTPNVYDPQNLNLYAYVNNNPIKSIDPTGHYSLAFIKSIKNDTNVVLLKTVVKGVSKGIGNIYSAINKELTGVLSKREATVGSTAKSIGTSIEALDTVGSIKDTMRYSESINNNKAINPKDALALKIARCFENFSPSKHMTPGSGEMLKKHGLTEFGEYHSARYQSYKNIIDSPSGSDEEDKAFLQHEKLFPH